MTLRYSLCITVLLSLVLAASQLDAQQYYTVTTSTATYQELVGAITLVDKPDTLGYGTTLPFAMEGFGLPLNFNNQASVFYIFTGGFVAVDVPSHQRLYVFDAFVSRLIWRDDNSRISYTLTGAPGARELKVQWKNLGMVGHAATDYVNMQLWLSEKDNSFEVHVGPNHVTGTAAYYGNGGPAIGAFVATYDFSNYDHAIHVIGNPAHPGIDALQGYYPLAGTPADGTVYRFAYTKPSAVEPERPLAGTIALSPNPCRERSRIGLPASSQGRATLVLRDALGREVLRMAGVADGDMIERGDLAAGVYYVQLFEGRRLLGTSQLTIAE